MSAITLINAAVQAYLTEFPTVREIVERSNFKDKLLELTKGRRLPHGNGYLYTWSEDIASGAQGQFDFSSATSGNDLLAKNRVTVHEQYIYISSPSDSYRIALTVDNEELYSGGFFEAGAVGSIISNMTGKLRKAKELYMYGKIKALIANYAPLHTVQKQGITLATGASATDPGLDNTSAIDAIKLNTFNFKSALRKLLFKFSKWNKLNDCTAADGYANFVQASQPEELYIIFNEKYYEDIDLGKAVIYHDDPLDAKGGLEYYIAESASLAADGVGLADGLIAIVCDKEKFQHYTRIDTTRSFEVASGLYTNYFAFLYWGTGTVRYLPAAVIIDSANDPFPSTI